MFNGKARSENQERHFQNFTYGSCSSTAAKEKKKELEIKNIIWYKSNRFLKKERITNKEYFSVQN